MSGTTFVRGARPAKPGRRARPDRPAGDAQPAGVRSHVGAEPSLGGLLLRDVLDGLFAFVGLLTPDGTLVEANRAALQAAGLRPEDVLGLPFEQTYWWSYSPDVQAR